MARKHAPETRLTAINMSQPNCTKQPPSLIHGIRKQYTNSHCDYDLSHSVRWDACDLLRGCIQGNGELTACMGAWTMFKADPWGWSYDQVLVTSGARISSEACIYTAKGG